MSGVLPTAVPFLVRGYPSCLALPIFAIEDIPDIPDIGFEAVLENGTGASFQWQFIA